MLSIWGMAQPWDFSTQDWYQISTYKPCQSEGLRFLLGSCYVWTCLSIWSWRDYAICAQIVLSIALRSSYSASLIKIYQDFSLQCSHNRAVCFTIPGTPLKGASLLYFVCKGSIASHNQKTEPAIFQSMGIRDADVLSRHHTVCARAIRTSGYIDALYSLNNQLGLLI